jgi:hypothetical protein
MAAASPDSWVNGERRSLARTKSFLIPELGRRSGMTAAYSLV